MKTRIETLLRAEHISSSKFADVIGVQRSSVSHILSGRNNPSLDFIQKILNRFPLINSDWLLSGRGNMYKTATTPTTESTPKVVEQSLFGAVQSNNQPVVEKSSLNADNSNNINGKVENATSEIQNIAVNTDKSSKKSIDKIVIFYSDKSFKEYSPTE